MNAAMTEKETMLLRQLEAEQAKTTLLRRALIDASCFWQAVAAHYGTEHFCRRAETEALAIRDTAIAATAP